MEADVRVIERVFLHGGKKSNRGMGKPHDLPSSTTGLMGKKSGGSVKAIPAVAQGWEEIC